MEIVNITKNEMFMNLISFLLIILIVIIFIIASTIVTSNKNEDTSFKEFIISTLVCILFLSPIWIPSISEFKESNQYTIEYNSGTLEKTMTTQEIIDLVKNKSIFDEKKEYTSTVTINVPNGEKSNSFDNYIEWIRENTNTQRINQYEQEKAQKLNEKYLNETHNVNVKN